MNFFKIFFYELNKMDSFKYLNIKSFIFAFITLFTYAYSEQCRKYKCGTLGNNICLELNFTLDNDEVTGQLCENKDLRCPYSDFSFSSKVSCEKPKNITILQYPGGVCSTNKDCINGGECNQNKCQSVNEGNTCMDSSDCNYGFACYINDKFNSTAETCNKLKSMGANCINEFECQMNQGCFNGVCTNYFSLPDGTNLRPNNMDNQYSFCSSGDDQYGYCDSLKNINESEETTDELVPCDESNPCRYKSINGTVTRQSLCKCGKSTDGSRYCPIFGGNSKYAYGIKQMKDLINVDKSQCNTIERGVNCNSQISSNKNDASILSFNTLNTKLNYYHLFAKAEDCIQKIYFPSYQKAYDPDPVNPEGKCPIYSCKSSDNTANKTCANNIYTKSDKKFYVDLFSYSCNWNSEICKFDRTFVKEEFKNSQCAEKDDNTGRRFPGEACKTNSDCFIKDGVKIEGIGECKNNICSGFDKGAECKDTSQCLSGYYCKSKKVDNINVSTCEAQLKEGDDCESMFDCRNNFICKDKKCKNQYFMMTTGEKIKNADYSEKDKNYLNKLCNTQMATSDITNTICIEKRHVNATDPSQSNLVPCNLNQRCVYNLTDDRAYEETKYEDCACGYNNNAQGYCPMAFNASK